MKGGMKQMLLIQDTLPFQKATAHLFVLSVFTTFFTRRITNHFSGAAGALPTCKSRVPKEAFEHRS